MECLMKLFKEKAFFMIKDIFFYLIRYSKFIIKNYLVFPGWAFEIIFQKSTSFYFTQISIIESTRETENVIARFINI